MDELLTAENLDFRRRAREVAETYVRPIAAKLDETEEYPWEILKRLKEANLHGVWIPKEYGGQGAGILNLCIVVEELSRACGGVGVAFAVNALGSLPILLGGTEEQKKKWLPRIASGDDLIAFCLSEKDAGSDAGSLQTRAAKQPDGTYVINGDKKWTTNGGAANIYTVFTRTDPTKEGPRGLSAFIVQKGEPGFTIGWKELKMGIRCVPVHETHFKDVKVGPDRLLGGTEGHGFRHSMSTLDRARPCVAAQALEDTMTYLGQRIAFGEPLATKQVLRHRVADMATEIEAARQLVYHAAGLYTAGEECVKEVSMAKLFATEVANRVAYQAVQLHGGYGYMREFPVERFFRDVRLWTIASGTSEMMREIIARRLPL